MITPREPKRFIPFKLTGGRFDKAGVNLDAFSELRAYRDVLRAIARDIYFAEYPDAKRAPNGIDKALDFNFHDYIDGSVVPTVTWAEATSDLEWIQMMSHGQVEDMFNRIIENQDWSSAVLISDTTKKVIAKFGATLRDDEAIVYTNGIPYTAKIRQRLMESLDKSEDIKSQPLVGFITEIDAGRNSFKLRLPTGKTVPGEFTNPDLFRSLLPHLNKVEEGSALRLICDYRLVFGGVEKITDVYDIEVFIARDSPWSERMFELIFLRQGWVDGQGKAVVMDTAELAMKVLEGAQKAGYSLPHIFPTPEGGIQLEHHQGTKHLELTISPDDEHEGFYYDSSTDETIEEELSTPNAMVDFLGRWEA
ncbi:hypothetical protein [Rothia nasimurium]|uniref:hypothetical protein n=1 Tax=Rothia nasimurium TaxID=85336 RepID=UPI003BA1F74F